MESKALVKSTNINVAWRFFARTPSRILRMVDSINNKTVLFQVIQFCISIQVSSIWPVDKAQSGAITPGQSRPGSDGNNGAFLEAPALLEPHY